MYAAMHFVCVFFGVSEGGFPLRHFLLIFLNVISPRIEGTWIKKVRKKKGCENKRVLLFGNQSKRLSLSLSLLHFCFLSSVFVLILPGSGAELQTPWHIHTRGRWGQLVMTGRKPVCRGRIEALGVNLPGYSVELSGTASRLCICVQI